MASPSTSTLRSGTTSRRALPAAAPGKNPAARCCWRLLLERREEIAAEPAAATAARRRRAAGGPPKSAEIEELRRGRPGDPDQQRDRNRQRDQRAGFGEHPQKGLRLRHSDSIAMDGQAVDYNSGIRPQAGRFHPINRASAAAVKDCAGNVMFRVTFGAGNRLFQRPRSRSSTSEEANPSAGAPIEAWKPRSASRVWPPNWPSGVPR